MADFISKLGIALEEADESLYWLEMLVEANLVTKPKAAALIDEATQLVAILTASSKTAKSRFISSKNLKSEIKNQKFPGSQHQRQAGDLHD